MDRLREVFTYVSAAMGTFALILTVYQAANNNFRSALVLLLVVGLCGCYVYLAQIKAFRVWQIEVQLADKLNQANVILDQLKNVAVLNAKAAYLNIGKGQRWSSSDWVEKQAMLDEIDAQLKSLKVSDKERRELGATYLKIAGFDFYMLYVNTLQRYISFKPNELLATLNQDNNNTSAKVELQRFRDRANQFKPNYQLFSQLQTYSLSDELRRLSVSWMSEPDQKAVEAFRNQILSLYKASEEKGGLTKEAAEYYDRYSDLGGQDKKIIELFGFNPSALR